MQHGIPQRCPPLTTALIVGTIKAIELHEILIRNSVGFILFLHFVAVVFFVDITPLHINSRYWRG